MNNKAHLTLLLLATLGSLSACTTMGNTANNNAAPSPSNKLEVTNLSPVEQIQAYEDQLIKDPDTPYATLTNLQVVKDYRTAPSYAPNPYGIYAVDGVEVRKLPYSIFGNGGWYTHAAKMAVADVKIPAGKHVVDLGQITAWNRNDFTLPAIDFKPYTSYITVFEGSKDQRYLSVYTYEQDRRFSRLDRDAIILKDKIASIKIK